MTFLDVVAALLLSGLAMYGLGLPLAWLLPAPETARWIYRIAVAPALAITLATACAFLLRVVGVPLHPAQLAALLLAAWGVAWWRTRDRWDLRAAVRGCVEPALMIGTAGALWLFSLLGFGLYLPNRDFKNHATFVAQVAYTQTADPAWVLRSSPLDPPLSAGGYPLGLHTLLGWALPTPDWNSIGVTAAAAVLATAISLPLAMVALARMWAPGDRQLALLAGFAVVVLPGITFPFLIGSVVLLAGTALYAAGLATLWYWLRHPGLGSTVALAAVGFGLLVLHIAEALALALVLLLCLPVWLWRRRSRLRLRTWLLLGLGGLASIGLGVLVVSGNWELLTGPATAWDIEADEFDVGGALLVALVRVVSARQLVGLLWMPLVLVGIWVSHRRRQSWFPTAALLPALVLAVLASASGVPTWLHLVSAPWYGSIARVSLVAGPPTILLACLSMVALVAWVRCHVTSSGLGRAVVAASALVMLALILVPGARLVPDRRESLAATLAGAGDTVEVARWLRDRLGPGEHVLTFEGDGGALLFAAARVPVVAARTDPADPAVRGTAYAVAIDGLARLDDPRVADAFADLGVAYVVVGTSSLYWSEQPGFDLDTLLAQPQLREVRRGTDLVVLEYEPEA